MHALTHSNGAMCSRAGLVVVAHLVPKQAVASILVGAPKRLMVLQQIDTGRVAADFGDLLKIDLPDVFEILAWSRVRICELTTGRCAEILKQPGAAFMWLPCPRTQASLAMGQHDDHPVRLVSAPSGTACPSTAHSYAAKIPQSLCTGCVCCHDTHGQGAHDAMVLLLA